MRRRRGRPDERRAEILAAALKVFAERGYRGSSLAAVAERVGLTQQGVLHHFPTKDALLIEVLKLRDEIDAQTFMAGGATLAQVEKLMEHNATQPGLVQSFTVLSADSVTENHPAKDHFTSRYAAVRAAVAQALRAELGDELPGGITPDQAATLMIAVMDGLQLQWLLDPEEVDLPTLFRAYTTLIRGG